MGSSGCFGSAATSSNAAALTLNNRVKRTPSPSSHGLARYRPLAPRGFDVGCSAKALFFKPAQSSDPRHAAPLVREPRVQPRRRAASQRSVADSLPFSSAEKVAHFFSYNTSARAATPSGLVRLATSTAPQPPPDPIEHHQCQQHNKDWDWINHRPPPGAAMPPTIAFLRPMVTCFPDLDSLYHNDFSS